MVSKKNIEALESLQGMSTYSAGIAQATAYRLLKKFTEECIAEHDLTMMQWYIIGSVYEATEAGEVEPSVGDLARVLDTGLPYITNTVNLLESRGIVERKCCKDDSRVKRVLLKPACKQMVLQIEEDMRNKMRAALYPAITPNELLTYIKVVYKLNSVLDSATDQN